MSLGVGTPGGLPPDGGPKPTRPASVQALSAPGWRLAALALIVSHACNLEGSWVPQGPGKKLQRVRRGGNTASRTPRSVWPRGQRSAG